MVRVRIEDLNGENYIWFSHRIDDSGQRESSMFGCNGPLTGNPKEDLSHFTATWSDDRFKIGNVALFGRWETTPSSYQAPLPFPC